MSPTARDDATTIELSSLMWGCEDAGTLTWCRHSRYLPTRAPRRASRLKKKAMVNDPVLHLEANEPKVHLIRVLLMCGGCSAVQTRKGWGGIPLVEEQFPAPTLLEVHLPGRDGYEIAHHPRCDAQPQARPSSQMEVHLPYGGRR